MRQLKRMMGSQIMVDDGYFLFRRMVQDKWFNGKDSTEEGLYQKYGKYGKVNSRNIWKGIKFVKKGDDEEEDD